MANHVADDDCRGLGMILETTLSKALCKIYLLCVKHWHKRYNGYQVTSSMTKPIL